LRRHGELGMSAVDQWIRLVGPVNQEARGDDQMQGYDGNNHQRCDLSADASKVQKAKKLHGQLPAAGTGSTLIASPIASTLGVNM
jgi:hypothetical protein